MSPEQWAPGSQLLVTTAVVSNLVNDDDRVGVQASFVLWMPQLSSGALRSENW